jgi:hypothetical protein
MTDYGFKRFISAALGLCLLAVTGLAEAAVLWFMPASGNVPLGSELVVTIQADSEGSDLVVADVIVEYAPTALELLEISTLGSDFSYDFGLAVPDLFPLKQIDGTAGRAQVVVAVPNPGVNGSQLNVVTLRFRALAAGEQVPVSFVFTEPGAAGDSNMVLDDGNGTDGLTAVVDASFSIGLELDTDGDGWPDYQDNCSQHANSDQRDTDNDNYGNRCDADLNDDDFVNVQDLGLFKNVFFTNDTQPGYDEDADINGDGYINSLDLGLFKNLFFKEPGPSGLAP